LRKVAKQDQPVSPSTLRPKSTQPPPDEMMAYWVSRKITGEFDTLHNNVRSSIKTDKNFQTRYLNENTGKADMNLEESKEIFMNSCPFWTGIIKNIINHHGNGLSGEILNYLF
jgi:hypothetical protein